MSQCILIFSIAIVINLSILRNLNVWLDVPELSLESRDNFLSCHCLLKKNKLLIRMTLIDFRTAILLKTSQQTCLTKTQESARSYQVIQGQSFSNNFFFFLILIKENRFSLFSFLSSLNSTSIWPSSIFFFNWNEIWQKLHRFFQSHLTHQFDVKFRFKWLKK